MDRYLVINSDGHAGLPPERYRDYLDPQYRDEFDRQHAARMAMLAQAGERLEMAQESAKWAEDKAHGLAGAWDSDRRNEVLDADGVAAEILYVDGLTERNSPPFGGDLGLLPMGANPELQWAGARSHTATCDLLPTPRTVALWVLRQIVERKPPLISKWRQVERYRHCDSPISSL